MKLSLALMELFHHRGGIFCIIFSNEGSLYNTALQRGSLYKNRGIKDSSISPKIYNCYCTRHYSNCIKYQFEILSNTPDHIRDKIPFEWTLRIQGILDTVVPAFPHLSCTELIPIRIVMFQAVCLMRYYFARWPANQIDITVIFASRWTSGALSSMMVAAKVLRQFANSKRSRSMDTFLVYRGDLNICCTHM